jgi:hypothetical protein
MKCGHRWTVGLETDQGLINYAVVIGEPAEALGQYMIRTLLAKLTIRPEDARNPVRHLGSERGFPLSVAVQIATSKFAKSVIIRPQIYGRLGDRIPAAPDVIARRTDWAEVSYHPSFSPQRRRCIRAVCEWKKGMKEAPIC